MKKTKLINCARPLVQVPETTAAKKLRDAQDAAIATLKAQGKYQADKCIERADGKHSTKKLATVTLIHASHR